MYRHVMYLFVFAIVSLAVACGDDDGRNGNNNINNGGETLVLEAPVDSAGGIIVVDDPNSPIYGTRLSFPEGCLPEDVMARVYFKTETTVSPGPHALKVSRVFRLETDPVVSFRKRVEVTLPVDDGVDPETQIVLPFFLDEETGVKRLLAPLRDVEGPNAAAVTFWTSHFSMFYLLAWEGHTSGMTIMPNVIDIDYTPSRDGFELPNFTRYDDFGSYDEGHCGGMSIYSAWYFSRKVMAGIETTRLSEKYRQGDNNDPFDDNLAVEVAIYADVAFSPRENEEEFWAADRVAGQVFPEDAWVAERIVAALQIQNESQLIQLGKGDELEHLVVVYGYEDGKFLIYDPNFEKRDDIYIAYDYLTGFADYDYNQFDNDLSESFNSFSLGTVDRYLPDEEFDWIYASAEIDFSADRYLPDITVESHDDFQVVTDPSITLRGSVIINEMKENIHYTGFVEGLVTSHEFDFAPTSGTFSVDIPMELGPNTIYLYAGYRSNNSSENQAGSMWFLGNAALLKLHIVYAPCADNDGDGYGVGPGCLGDDCDDGDPTIWTGCVGCADGDGDGHDGYDAVQCPNGDDECDSDPNNWTFVGCISCVDTDNDGYGTDCDLGNDCDDSDPGIWTGCVDCVDEDGDGYGVGVDCLGEDCDDTDPGIWIGCWTTIAVGKHHACTIKFDGTAWCWGDNGWGQLGDGTNTYSLTPVQVVGLSSVESISSFYDHTCALRSDGTAWCWGLNTFGQLGDGTSGTSSAIPVQTVGLNTVITLEAGEDHTCALLSNGTVSCWGHNGWGQLGNGTTTDNSTPVPVSGMSAAVSISAGGSHTCVIKTDDTVWCWGFNSYGQLGDETTAITRSVPVLSTGISTAAAALSAGRYHTCAIKTDGTAWCWGDNSYGKLGDGTINDSAVPVQVLGLTDVEKLVPKTYHTCAIKTDGTAWCWGRNYLGQLGDGTTTDQHSPVEVIVVASTFLDLALGFASTCAIKASDGSTLCWGQL